MACSLCSRRPAVRAGRGFCSSRGRSSRGPQRQLACSACVGVWTGDAMGRTDGRFSGMGGRRRVSEVGRRVWAVLLVLLGVGWGWAFSPAAASASVTTVVSEPGEILDATPARVLYITDGSPPQLKIHELASNETITVPVPAGRHPVASGSLIGGGALFASEVTDVTTVELEEWQNGQLTSLGPLNSLDSIVVAGDYAIWSDGPTLLRRDLAASQTVTVATDAGNTTNDVSAQGDVVYWDYTYSIRRWHNGSSVQISHQPPSTWATYPVTDGVNVVYRETSPCCGAETGSVAFSDGQSETLLDSYRTAWPWPPSDYLASNGWIAFTRPQATPSGPLQVLTRDPQGAVAAVSADGQAASIEGLNPTGQVMYTTNQGNYLAAAGEIPFPLGSGLGRPFWADNHWYFINGGSLLRVDTDTAITSAPPAQTAAADTSFQFTSTAQSPTFRCQLDRGSWETCSSPHSYSNLTDGTHTFSVAATDTLTDEVDPTPASTSWVVDTTPPAPFALISPADNAPVTAHPAFTWQASSDSGTGLDHYDVWIDGSKTAQVPAGTTTYMPSLALSEGSHTWQVLAVDAVGNARQSTSRSFTGDATHPEPFSNLAPADGSRFSEPNPTLQWTASSDTGSGLGGYRVVIDGAHISPDLPPTAISYTPSTDLPDGTHSWQVQAFDSAGNIRPGPIWQFIVDTKPPIAAITPDSKNTLTGGTVSLDASGSSDPEGAAIVNYEWDPEGTGSFTSTTTTASFQHSYSNPGAYSATVRVTNSVGLSSTASVTITVHPAPPLGATGVSINGAALYTNDPHVTLSLVWSAFADTVLVSNDGGFVGAQRFPVSATIPWTLISAGSERLPKIVYVRFDDSTQTFTDDIILDTVPPVVSAATETPAAAAARIAPSTGGYRISIHASDDNSGLASIQLAAATAHPGTVLPFATSTVYEGALAPRWVRVQDRAGNFSAWHQVTQPAVPRLAVLSVRPATFKLSGRLVEGHCAPTSRANRHNHTCVRELKLRVSYKLNMRALLRLTLKRIVTGRSVNGRCVKPNPKRDRCTRLLPVRGTLTRTGNAGANAFMFNGTIGGHKLAPGTYRLTATPSTHARTGAPQTARFTIRR